MKKYEIISLQNERDNYQRLYSQEKKEKEELQKVNTRLTNSIEDLTKGRDNELRNLREIIRWHINPETTKYPFVPEKSQIDPESYRKGINYQSY